MSREEDEERKGKSRIGMAGGLLKAVGGKFSSATAFGWEVATDILLGQEYDEYDDAPEDPKVIFENACKVANENLTKMANEFGLPEDEISATYQQLRKKEVTISTHGRHSCGKSTLLNALLDDSLLPTCLENNTGVRVTIKHSDSVHRGMCPSPTPCEKCPKLTTTRTGARCHTPIVHGARDVRNALEEINNVSRKLTSEVDEVDSQATECILTTNLPMLSGVERGWELSILDNPGYGEANQEDMMQETETTMKTSSALLYVMDVGQLQDSEDARRLQQLHTADKGIFADSNRLTVAVTQYDKVYSESREWSKEEIQRRVCAFIERQTGRRVQPEVVLPVCGKWAFDARQLKQKQCQDDKALLRRVRSALVLCPNAPGGQENMSQEEPLDVLADRLLSVTGIEVLENRITMMASVCVRTWVSSLSQKYHNYLEMVVKRLDISIQETAAELTHFKESHTTVLRQYNELRDLARNLEDETVLGRLRECCEQDILAAKESAKQVLEDFHRQCRSEIEAKRRDFGPQEYEDRITVLLTEEFSEKLCATVFDASRGFTHGWNIRNEAISNMKRGIRRMKQAAEKFLALSSQRSTDDVDYSEEEISAPEEIDNFEGVFKGKKLTFENFKNKVKIPNLDLTWGQWFSNGFWWGISRLKISNPPIYTYSSAECVTETMEQTDSYVKDTLNSYLQGLELSVAESFFSNYRRITKTHLSSYEERYKGRVEQQKKKGDEHLRELSGSLQLLGEEKTRVQQFQWRLKHASEEYNHVLCKNEFVHVYV